MFSSCRATCPSSPGELGQGTWTTAGCRVTSSLSITPRFQAGNSVCLAPAETRTWTRTWTRNLDKFYHVFSSYRATCPSSPGELGQGTWTTAGCRVTSSLSIRPDSRQAIPCASPLSLEGVFQMDSILPERLPALVRPAFDLVLQRIRSLKRCVQACGCKIMTPRYAPQFGSRLHFKRCQPLPKETPFPFFLGTPFFGTPFFLFFVFLSPAKVGSLEMQPGAKLQDIGVIIRILCRTRSNAGRTSAGSLSGRIESIWKTPSKKKHRALRPCNGVPGGAPASGARFNTACG